MKKFITARELAEELLKNPDDIVCSVSNNFELNGATVPKTSIYLHRFDGEVKSRGFRDAFDGDSYNTDVVSYNEKCTTKFVQI